MHRTSSSLALVCALAGAASHAFGDVTPSSAQLPDAPLRTPEAAPDMRTAAATNVPTDLPAVEAWSLAKATHASLDRSPEAQRARATLEAARAFRAIGTMARVGNPIVTARAMIGKPDGPAATYALFLGLPFDFSGKRAAYRNEATWLERQAEADLLVAQNDARSAARTAYVEVALGEAQLRALRLNEETAHDFSSRVRARFDVKAATALDLALSERDYAESVANRARAERDLAEARRAFRQALDLDAHARLNLDPLPQPSVPAGLTATSVGPLAVTQRREATAFAAGAERKRASDNRIRREAIAPVTVAAEGERQGVNNPQSTVGASVSGELPIILKNQGERAVVRGEANVLEVERGLAERKVAREAFAALERLEAVLVELAAIDTQAMPAAEQALSMTNEMLEVGAVDVFRVLTARQVAFDLRVRRVAVLRDAWLLRVALERAVGHVEEGR